jgi:hypothetical protein
MAHCRIFRQIDIHTKSYKPGTSAILKSNNSRFLPSVEMTVNMPFSNSLAGGNDERKLFDD